MYDRQTAILMECFDLMAELTLYLSLSEKLDLIESIIELLDSYPTPQHPNKNKNNPLSQAYILVLLARNTAKMATLGHLPYTFAMGDIESCFERALGLLTDENK